MQQQYTAEILLWKNTIGDEANAPPDQLFHLLYHFGQVTVSGGVLRTASETRRCRLESIPAYNVTQEAAALNIWDNLRKFIRYDYRAEAIMQEFGSAVDARY